MKQHKIINNSEIKPILLNLLKVFDTICRENGIEYSLCGGTLLGAVRHKGFIPWDDDVDVFVTRKNYDKICKIIKRYERKNDIKLLNYYKKGYFATFAKIIDTRTFSSENKRNEKLGVWMDVHIIDRMPTKKIDFYNSFIRDIKNIRYFGSNNYFKVSGNNKLIRWLKKKIKLMVRPFIKMVVRNRIDSFIKNNSGIEEISFSFGDKVSFWCNIDNLCFDNLVELDFEDLKVKCIKNYDRYLTAKYGDYMEIPNPDQRVLHDVKCCFWK